jgi:hypothetical protein
VAEAAAKDPCPGLEPRQLDVLAKGGLNAERIYDTNDKGPLFRLPSNPHLVI